MRKAVKKKPDPPREVQIAFYRAMDRVMEDPDFLDKVDDGVREAKENYARMMNTN